MENYQMIPFVINSNICIDKECTKSFDLLMDTVADNVGNSYITWSLLKEIGCPLELLEGHHIPNLNTYDFRNMEKDLDIINNDCTHVILILQDQIRIKQPYRNGFPFKGLSDFVRKIDKPILVADLGANSFNGYDSEFHKKLDRELIDFLHVLSSCCKVIGLRGSYTQEVLHNLGVDNTSVIGCPSYYETGRDRVLVKTVYSESLRIGTSSGAAMLGIGPIYLQDMFEGRIIKAMYYDEHYRLSWHELRLLDEGKYRFFASIDRWKDDIQKSIDFYIGARVHGSMIAMNSGVPAVVTNGDSRATEMCEYMNIPHHPELIGCRNIEKILNCCDYSKMNNEYNDKLDIFIDFLRKNDFNYNPIIPSSFAVDNYVGKVAIGAGEWLNALLKGAVSYPKAKFFSFVSHLRTYGTN